MMMRMTASKPPPMYIPTSFVSLCRISVPNPTAAYTRSFEGHAKPTRLTPVRELFVTAFSQWRRLARNLGGGRRWWLARHVPLLPLPASTPRPDYQPRRRGL